jgi:hypothetical protein
MTRRPDASQTTGTVLMVRPASFGYDAQTAATNAFQRAPSRGEAELQSAALREFDTAVASLDAAGVSVLVLADTPEPPTPDAVFPNNWFSTHADGTVVLYPMAAERRRQERRPDALLALLRSAGHRVGRTIDFTLHERRGAALEGTGSLVLDRAHALAYACLSPRTDERTLSEWAVAMGFTTIAFIATDAQGVPLYHTNVLMWIGERVAAIAPGCIIESDRARVLDALASAGRDVIELQPSQVAAYAGNALEVRTRRSDPLVAMSATALAGLSPAQRRAIEAHAAILPLSVPTIETVGGGSVRCMLAEIFLPAADDA